MQFDILQNREAEESREALTGAYLRAPSAFLGDLRASLDALVRDADSAEATLASVWREVQSGARTCDASAGAMADALPVSRTLFRERVTEEQFARLCRALSDTERGRSEMQAALLSYTRVGESLRENHIDSFALKRRIYAVRGAASEADAPVLASCLERLQALFARCAELESALASRRERVGKLCFDTLPRFSDALRAYADMEGNGAACDAPRVRALCAELRTALKAFL